MTDLQLDIAQLIIDTLSLEDLAASDIDPSMPLFGDGLGLDSIDALELALALQKRYEIQIASDSRDARQHFATVASLAAFVEAQRTACAG
ncbi:phosphopantetheine-binding protein [Dyella sp. ASV21]|jgi:acyl carrier protein|uniref:phosphopantetheine-binding protein n=1 Tax=Dyella sp. ASV21 TaxID=2795114 RepID=UPI0018EB38A7|nr:phosphopantetheine-binding protein [Dyella sp. ASV21]